MRTFRSTMTSVLIDGVRPDSLTLGAPRPLVPRALQHGAILGRTAAWHSTVASK